MTTPRSRIGKAVALEPGDAKSLEQVGDLLQARGDLDGALKAYSAAVAIEPRRDLDAKVALLRGQSALARLPEQYRAIDRASEVTRGDVAALIGVRLARLIESGGRRETVLITDVRTHWAATWILAVSRAGIMEPFANHAFQPRAVMRRVDFAVAMARLLAKVGVDHPDAAKSWRGAPIKFPDLAPTHLAYLQVSQAVSAGVIKLGPDNKFQPSKTVSGAEAVEAIARIETLAGITSPAGDAR